MTEEIDICPFRVLNNPVLPDNMCIKTQSYCIFPLSYVECDVHKRYTRLVDVLTGEDTNEN